MKLNKAQEQIINHTTHPVLVTACAGAGKTFSLIQRTIKLVQSGVPQEEITIITFTKNSANDLLRKLKQHNLTGVNVGTFHRVCAKMLIKLGKLDLSKQVREYEVDNIWTKLNGNEKTDCTQVRSFISYQKAYNIKPNGTYQTFETEYGSQFLTKCYIAYENYKKESGIRDFDDILIDAYEELSNPPKGMGTRTDLSEFKATYLMVDEHQDSNVIQNKLIPLLCSTDNIMCIGDVRQTLYSFRGSSPQSFLDFTKTFPNATVIDMNTNYRSCSNLVEQTNTFAHNWYQGALFTDTIANNPNDGTITSEYFYEGVDEAEYVCDKISSLLSNNVKPSDIAVIYRNNDMSSLVELQLKQKGIPYKVEGDGSIFKMKEIRAILCILRLATNLEDNMAYEELFNTRTSIFKFMPNAILSEIRNYALSHDVSYAQASGLIHTPKVYQATNLQSIITLIKLVHSQSSNQVSLNKILGTIISTLKIITGIQQEGTYDKDKKESRIACVNSLAQFTLNSKYTINSFLDLAYGAKTKSTKEEEVTNSIQLMTVHKSKGLEWENVFFIGNQEGKFPSSYSPIEEEANVFYVGVTRAKTNIYLTTINSSTFVEQFI